MLKFYEQDHKYESIVPDGINWLGVTTLVGALKEKFNAAEQAPKSSKNSKSKWYKIPVEEILQAWENEGKRATELGHWYHNKRELELLQNSTVQGIPVIKSVIQDGVKIAPDQRLKEGIYPEHLVYLLSAGLCGQSDIVEVIGDKINIRDFKTSKEINLRSYENWEGVRKKMLKPLQHLEDCHIVHYSLQLSIYMYIILRHNPHLVPGTMIIDHIKFVKAGEDKYGYPLYHLGDGEPIIESIESIEVPYLKNEVTLLLNYIKEPKIRATIKK